MFGETAAVYAFLRLSHALAAIAVKTFSLLVVEFFDDFTQIEHAGMAESAWETLEGALGSDSIQTSYIGLKRVNSRSVKFQ